MQSSRKQFAFWLCPATAEREFFQDLIQRLALRLDAPIFDPHLTLQGGQTSVAEAEHALRSVAAPISLTLEVEGIASSDVYTKTVFVQFRPSPVASRISANIAGLLRSETSYHFDPHLSLIYKHMNADERETLRREIRLPFETVTFDLLRVIECPVPIAQREDVEAWRTLAERPLAEAAG